MERSIVNTQTKQLTSKLTLAIAALCALPAAWAQDNVPARNAGHIDPVVLPFPTVGDSREDPATAQTKQDSIWLQNSKAWSRIMSSISAQGANMLFFNGDMIMGYGDTGTPVDPASVDTVVKSDLVTTYRQYAFWRGMVAPLMEAGTYVVPVPGNHETQCKACGKKSQEANENAWRANMGDLIMDEVRFGNLVGAAVENFDADNHPQMQLGVDKSGKDGQDLITTNQSQLSYSFDVNGTHFAIINTDPTGNDGHAPVNWLKADLDAAKTRGAKHFFVFGHKPAYTYTYIDAATGLPITKAAGFDADPANRDAFWDVMEHYGATYFCGHEHIYNMMQPRKDTGGHAWQVLVGSGGSPFEASILTSANPASDRMYAWATVNVYHSGKVRIDAYGFDDQYGKTKHLKTLVLDQ